MRAAQILWQGDTEAAAANVPSTSVLDNFNRANENPLSDGGKWSQRTSTAMRVVSNIAASASTLFGSSYWNVQTFGPDTEVYATGTLVSSNFMRLYLRMSNPNAAGETAYAADWGPGIPGARILRETSLEVFTILSSNAALTVNVGDVVDFQAIGSALTLYRNGVSVLTASDGNLTGAGLIAMGARSFNLDDFGGGTIT